MTQEPEAPPPLEWNPPKPRELAGIREEIVGCLLNRAVRMQTENLLAAGKGTINPAPQDPELAAEILISEEHARLATAQLYSVTADMTQVAVTAGKKLPSWEVRPEDVPSDSGFMVFGEPIGQYAMDDGLDGRKTVSIVAVSWGPTFVVEAPERHLWLSFWSLTHHELGVRVLQEQLGFTYRLAREFQLLLGDYTWDNEALLTFYSQGIRVAGVPESVDPSEVSILSSTSASWVQTVRAAWLLMKRDGKRPITEVENVPLSKTVRRQLDREGMNSNAVRVVKLHGRHRVRIGVVPTRGYKVSVRSHVTGHVRWQPYPSRKAIEPIWIEEHVRGPEGAPFKEKTTVVKVLDRPPG